MMPTRMKTASPAEYAAALIGQTENNPQLSPAQKRNTILGIKAAQRGMPGGGVTAIPGGAGGSLDLTGGSKDAAPFSGIIEREASKYGVPGLAQVAARVLHVESGGNANAASSAGAHGLMQLMPDTARGLGVTNPNDPHQNIMGGVKYLAQLFGQFKSWPLAIAAFNAGPGNVARLGMRALMVPGADPQYVTKVLGG